MIGQDHTSWRRDHATPQMQGPAPQESHPAT